MSKNFPLILLIALFVICLFGAGVFLARLEISDFFSGYFSNNQEINNTQPQSNPTLKLLNSHSHPGAGEEWIVSFETTGPANLTITPTDQDTINDLDFVSLTCSGEERTPQILVNDVIFYANWQCDGIRKVIHLVNIAGTHALKFQFGDQAAYAYNNPDETTYNFVGVTQASNDYYAYEKSGAASFTNQDDIGDSEALDTDYDNIESTNDVRWTTEGASTDGHYDSQLYKFYIDEDESSVTQLDFLWEGYGETQGTGYPTDFYAWNYNTSQWDLLQEVTFTAATDQNLTGSKTTDAGNYIDADKEVTLMVKTKKYVVPPPFCSQEGDYNSTSTVSGDLVYCDNSGRLWTPTAIIGGSVTAYQWGGALVNNPSCIGVGGRPACNYCDGLAYAGYSDWELPSCVSGAKNSNCILYQFGIDTCGGYPCTPSWDTTALASIYWSSTQHSDPSWNYAWGVTFNNGSVSPWYKGNSRYIRCVRGQ